MKTLTTLMAVLAITTFSFANDTDPKKEKNTADVASTEVAVMANLNKMKLFYVSPDANKVKVKMFNEQGYELASTVVFKTQGFILPFDISALESGTYTFEIEDENGTVVRTLDYNREMLKGLSTAFYKNKGEEIYNLHVKNTLPGTVTLTVMDENSNVLYTSEYTEDFATKIDISQVENAALVKVSNQKTSNYHYIDN